MLVRMNNYIFVEYRSIHMYMRNDGFVISEVDEIKQIF